MTDWLSLDDVHGRLKEIYTWFAREAPGVQVQETGEVEALWALADIMHEEEREKEAGRA